MIVIHHLNSSQSHRIIWLMEELGCEYEVKHYKRDAVTSLAPPELEAVHPMGSAPVITDGDITLAESGAIIEYILFKYGKGKLRPKEDTSEWIQYLYWMQFANATLLPITFLRRAFRIAHARSPFFIKPITKVVSDQMNKLYIGHRIEKVCNTMESALTRNKFFAGDEFTGADIQMAVALILGNRFDEGELGPHVIKYIEGIKQRAAYIKTIEVAGPLGEY